MNTDNLKVAVSHFLDLVVNGRGDEEANLRDLIVALDMLAWMQHVVNDSEADDSAAPPQAGPDREFKKMRTIVEQQFPSFGYYSTPANPTDQNGEAELIRGNAAADLAEIACELYEVAWRFQNTSEADARRAFAGGYEKRWRLSLRTLQWYIERRR